MASEADHSQPFLSFLGAGGGGLGGCFPPLTIRLGGGVGGGGVGFGGGGVGFGGSSLLINQHHTRSSGSFQ